MLFKRVTQRYGRTPEPETPYQKAAQVWDERLGSARVQARNWRLMAFGAFAMSAALAVSLIWLSLQSHVTPYVVEVDALGEARAVVPAVQNYEPTDPQLAWHLGEFIKKVRSISADPVLVRENWLSAYDYADEKAALFLNQYARENDPFTAIGIKTVSVQITSVVRASETSFQVKWIEKTFERGALVSTIRWTGILTVSVHTPRTAESLRKNPLGIQIRAIDWSREFDAQPIRPVKPATSPDSGAIVQE